ncbi:MAG: glycosyltransferase [Candidatus Nitrosotenuis sp.]|nr:MAG: glycosyltransferase [Candidatus Nitrosotenuis sp.]
MNLSLTLNSRKTTLVLAMILALSAFTHLWNATGFPEIFYDEGIYLGRAMHVLSGQGPQEAIYYDHPYFGQIFLAGIFYAIGYPDSLNPTPAVSSIDELYLVPRMIMGLLAVFDTLLVYKITERKYGTKVAIFSSVFFAVMPISWILRRVLLDSILLPFLLLSILLALHSKEKKWLVPASGICLGLAIFTKVPVFTLIPLIAYLVYSQNKSKKLVVLWLIPVLLLPLAWPAQSLLTNHFANWEKDVLWQSHRINSGLTGTTKAFLAMDPVLFCLGIAGLIYSVIRKDVFTFLWMVPFMIFFALIGYSQYFYWIPILPAFCIASGVIVSDLGKRLEKEKLKRMIPYATFFVIAIFGLVNLALVINTDMTGNQFEALSFVANYAKGKDATVLASPVYSWVMRDALDLKNVKSNYDVVLFMPIPPRVILVADPHFYNDQGRGKQLKQVDDSTVAIKTFESMKDRYNVYSYPYSSLGYAHDAGTIKIKTNLP